MYNIYIGLSETIAGVQKNFVSEPVGRISAAVGQTRPGLKANVLVAETLKEALTAPIRAVFGISQFTGKKVFSLIGSVLGTGIQAATLIPLPLPGGRSIASVRGDISAVRQTIDQQARGNPESFRTIFDRIRSVRNDAATRAGVGTTQAA